MISKYKLKLEILNQIAKETGLKEFWLGGSATYHKAAKDIGISFNYDDYDLAVKGGEKEYISLIKKLKEHQFRIVKNRTYYLKFRKVFQIIAEKDLMHLDIAIVNDLSDLGHFNFESIFWHFPSGETYDPYNALKDIRQKKLNLIISPKNENPFILTSRFVKLCARFDIDFTKNKKLLLLSYELASLMKKWKSEDSFHGKYAKEHAYFGIVQAILRSRNRKKFIRILNKSKILNAIFPEISEKLETSNNLSGIEDAKSPGEVIRCLQKFIINDEKKFYSLNKKIISISNRLEKEDKEKLLKIPLLNDYKVRESHKDKNATGRIIKNGRENKN